MRAKDCNKDGLTIYMDIKMERLNQKKKTKKNKSLKLGYLYEDTLDKRLSYEIRYGSVGQKYKTDVN